MKRVLKRLGTLMIICVLCLSQSVQLPLQARQIVPAEAEAKDGGEDLSDGSDPQRIQGAGRDPQGAPILIMTTSGSSR